MSPRTTPTTDEPEAPPSAREDPGHRPGSQQEDRRDQDPVDGARGGEPLGGAAGERAAEQGNRARDGNEDDRGDVAGDRPGAWGHGSLLRGPIMPVRAPLRVVIHGVAGPRQPATGRSTASRQRYAPPAHDRPRPHPRRHRRRVRPGRRRPARRPASSASTIACSPRWRRSGVPSFSRQLDLLLRLLGSRAGSLVLAGRPVRFAELDQGGREAYLRRLAASPIAAQANGLPGPQAADAAPRVRHGGLAVAGDHRLHGARGRPAGCRPGHGPHAGARAR